MLAILVAPALVKVGVQPMAAHLFILYFGVMSLITPPIATAAFVAATIAKTDPMDAGWLAMRFGWASYIVPFLFVYSPAMIMNPACWRSPGGRPLAVRHLVHLRRDDGFRDASDEPADAHRVRRDGIMLLLPYQASAINGWLNLAGIIRGASW